MIEPASLFLMAGRQAFTQWNAPSSTTPVMCRHSSKDHVLDGLLAALRHVVDEIVDAAEFLQRGVGHRVDRLGVDHVGERGHRLAALAFDLLDDALGLGAVAPHVDHHGAAAGGKLQRHGAADAAAGAGDDGDAALQFLVWH